MEGFKTYSAYKTGASHIAKGMGCEDYAADYESDKVCIAAVSDGHGDKRCFRSAEGARIACKVSVECVKELIENTQNVCDALKHSPDRIITELERQIIREWNNGVNNDLSANPVTETELEGLPEDAAEAVQSGNNLNRVYGCTLIVCVVTEGFWFGIHIGDGKCVAAMNNGLYIQPVPWDENGCVGSRSTSICSSSAFSEFRYAYGTDIPTGLFAVSDGVEESFDGSGLNKCCYTAGFWVQTMQKEELGQKMDELLYQVTKSGSGDDVSIACILSKTHDIKKPYVTSEQVAEKLNELVDNIKAGEFRLDNLMKSKNETIESIDGIKNEIDGLNRKIALLEEQLKDKEQHLKSIDINLGNAAQQLQKHLSRFPKATETKKRIDEYWKSNGVAVTEDLNFSPKYSESDIEKVISGLDNPQPEKPVSDFTDKTPPKNNNPTSEEPVSDFTDKTSAENDKPNAKKSFFTGLFGKKK